MKKASKKKASADINPRHYETVRSPVITEKSTLASEQGKFVFNVCSDASKTDIKEAVEALFNVKVTKVNTLNRKGKAKLFRGVPGRKSDVKKAVVTLEAGQSIDFSTGMK